METHKKIQKTSFLKKITNNNNEACFYLCTSASFNHPSFTLSASVLVSQINSCIIKQHSLLTHTGTYTTIPSCKAALVNLTNFLQHASRRCRQRSSVCCPAVALYQCYANLLERENVCRCGSGGSTVVARTQSVASR